MALNKTPWECEDRPHVRNELLTFGVNEHRSRHLNHDHDHHDLNYDADDGQYGVNNISSVGYIYLASKATMKRNPSRAPSPTPTAFSGISNYRSESYRPLREKGNNLPAVPSLDQRIVAKTHFDELSRYLAAYLARGEYT